MCLQVTQSLHSTRVSAMPPRKDSTHRSTLHAIVLRSFFHDKHISDDVTVYTIACMLICSNFIFGSLSSQWWWTTVRALQRNHQIRRAHLFSPGLLAPHLLIVAPMDTLQVSTAFQFSPARRRQHLYRPLTTYGHRTGALAFVSSRITVYLYLLTSHLIIRECWFEHDNLKRVNSKREVNLSIWINFDQIVIAFVFFEL